MPPGRSPGKAAVIGVDPQARRPTRGVDLHPRAEREEASCGEDTPAGWSPPRRVGCRHGQDQESGRSATTAATPRNARLRHRKPSAEPRRSTRVASVAVPAGAAVGDRWVDPVGVEHRPVSEEYAIGAAAAGYDPNALRHGRSLGDDLSRRHAASACAAAGACGELIQAVVAAGLNPGAFGGIDLLTTLGHFYATSSGAFGAAPPSPRRSPSRDWSPPPSRSPPPHSTSSSPPRTATAAGATCSPGRPQRPSQRHQLHRDGADGARRRRHPQPGRRRARPGCTPSDSDGGFPYQAGPAPTPIHRAGAPGAARQRPESQRPGLDHRRAQPARRADRHPGRQRRLQLPGNPPIPSPPPRSPPPWTCSPIRPRGVHRGLTPGPRRTASSRPLLYLQAQQSATDGSIPLGPSSRAQRVLRHRRRRRRLRPQGPGQGTGPSVMNYLAAHAARPAAPPAPAASYPGGGRRRQGPCLLRRPRPGHHPRPLLRHQLRRLRDGLAFTQALAVQGLVAASQPVPAGAINLPSPARTVTAAGTTWTPGRPQRAHQLRHQRHQLHRHGPDGARRRRHARPGPAALGLVAHPATARRRFPLLGRCRCSDPNSTALVLQAMLATGQNPNAPAWTIAGHTPSRDLIATQDPNGGFNYPGNPTPIPSPPPRFPRPWSARDTR